MMMRTLIKQTAFLSGSHFLVRAVGFIMRIWLSRELGTQAMGLVELAQSAQMLLITPVVSGIPASVSRMCAKHPQDHRPRILRSAILLALAVSLPLCICAFALRIPLALWLGDIRTLPALLVYLPCIPVLGISSALNGYYYGKGNPVPPALSEILEQLVRFFLCLQLVTLMKGWPVILTSAIPAAAALLGEAASLIFMLFLSAPVLIFGSRKGKRKEIYTEMIGLALPLTGMRIVSSLMRTVSSVLIPARLQASGLRGTEALSKLGMLNGMMMPVLMLPSFITCSLNMVSAPELARRQAQQRPIARFIRRILCGTLCLGIAAAASVYLLAPFFSNVLYRQAELLPLLRRCCMLIPVMSLTQVTGGLMNGLGMQRFSLRIALLSNLISVILTYLLSAMPALRLWGVILSMAAAQAVTLALNLHALSHADTRHDQISYQRISFASSARSKEEPSPR